MLDCRVGIWLVGMGSCGEGRGLEDRKRGVGYFVGGGMGAVLFGVDWDWGLEPGTRSRGLGDPSCMRRWWGGWGD